MSSSDGGEIKEGLVQLARVIEWAAIYIAIAIIIHSC